MLVHSHSGLSADCGIIVNSTNTGGLYTQSDACIAVSEIGITATSWYTDNVCETVSGFSTAIDPTPVTEVTPSPDPLAHLSPPPETALPCWQGAAGWNIDSPAKVALIAPNQKYCKGLKIACPVSVCGVINLPAGNYVIAGERLEIVGADTVVTGTGVMFYNTDWPGEAINATGILIGSNTTVDISAPTSGDYQGILMYVDRTLPAHTANIEVMSNSDVTLTGALYAFNQKVVFNSSVTASDDDVDQSLGVAIVADMIEVTSDTILKVPVNNFSGFPGGSPIKRVTLLQ